MLCKTYGKIGIKVSAVGFGGMRFDTSRPNEENAELLHYALNKGINYFDTAPGYCNDQSQKIFGIALKSMRGEFYVSTKGMPQTFDTAAKAREAVMKSLDILGVPKIDFYHVWCLRHMDHYRLAMKPGGQYEGLLRCKEEGLIDHIVFSSHQPGREIRQILEDGKFDGVLMGINILNFPYRWDGVKAAEELGYGVVAMNPLGGGAIPENADKLGFLASNGETPVEAALRFAITSPQITIALNGFTTREHIDMACRVADTAKPFGSDEIERVKKHLSENMNSVCTACGYCDQCPQEIAITGHMLVYNQKQMFGKSDEEMKKLFREEIAWGSLAGRNSGAADCVECGRCEELCTQRLNIIERLKQIASWTKA